MASSLGPLAKTVHFLSYNSDGRLEPSDDLRPPAGIVPWTRDRLSRAAPESDVEHWHRKGRGCFSWNKEGRSLRQKFSRGRAGRVEHGHFLS